jgi:uncharacterized protein YecE (DUF72 family)
VDQVKVGCCGFPKGMKHYFSQFKLVEVQQTFYKPPASSTAQKWRREAPEDFEFTIKAWQLITHPASSPTYRRVGLKIPQAKVKHYGFFKLSDEVLEAWEKTRHIANALQAKVILFQCPATFADCPDNAENMSLFFNHIDRDDFLFAWEPRGKWSQKSVVALCSDLDLIHCVNPLDKPPLYGKIKYFRLHGGPGYRHRYSDEELDRLTKISTSQTYILFNNINIHNDALRFMELIDRQG